MNLVIDANVFKAFYEEEVLQHPAPRPGRTASPAPIFENLGRRVFSYIDSGQQLEHEWRNVCRGGEEWFEGWLASAYESCGVNMIEINKTAVAEKNYRDVGFPSGGRDIWYIKVAVSVSCACTSNSAYLVSEDIDFYDPRLKKDSSREKCITSGSGPVARLLRKDRVNVCCIQSCVEKLA